MSSLKKTLMQKGMKLMSDPRVMKMMQDERVMKAVMAAMSVPGKAQSLAKELSKMKHDGGSEKGSSSKKKSSAAE